jgi:4-amino-4-deoxychorismate lyase
MEKLSWQEPFVQFGVGAFETMRYQNGNISLEAFHKRRLAKAIRHWSLKPHAIEVPWGMLHEQLKALDSRNVYRVKLLIGLGENNQLCAHVFHKPHQDNTAPRRLIRHRPHSNQLSPYKSSSYEQHFLARREAIRLGWDDAIYITEKGSLLETSTAAMFIKSDDDLFCVRQGDFLDSVLKNALLERFTNQVKVCRDIHLSQIHSNGLLMGNALQGLIAVDSVSEDPKTRTEYTPLGIEQKWIDHWNQRLFGEPS